jgi:hypothetical protein
MSRVREAGAEVRERQHPLLRTPRTGVAGLRVRVPAGPDLRQGLPGRSSVTRPARTVGPPSVRAATPRFPCGRSSADTPGFRDVVATLLGAPSLETTLV